MKHISRHFPHYFSLMGILIFGFVGFWLFSYDRLFQAAIAIGVAVSYVVWGIVHHKIQGDLETAVVIEYVLIAALGLLVALSLIFRT